MTTPNTPKTPRPTWTAVRVLRDRTAGRCLAGVLVSGFGTSALWLASGVWVKDLTGSDGLAALTMLAMWTPVLCGPLLGTLADLPRSRLRSTGRRTHPRVTLLVALNLSLAALLLSLLTVDSAADVWLVLVVLLLYGTAGVIQDAAESALVATSLDPALLGHFNGLRMTANEGMKLLAPLAGAGVYAAYGGTAVVLLDTGTFVLAAVLYAGLRGDGSPPPAPPTSSWRARTAEGVRHVWGHPRLRPLVVAAGTTMLCAGINGALVYAVIDGLGHPPAYAGVLAAVQGAGSVAVGLGSGAALRHLGDRRFAVCGMALTGVAVALRAVPSDLAALVGGVGVGAGLPCVLITAFTAVQRLTPDALRGRAAATASTLVFVPNVVGLAVGAALVEPLPHGPLLVLLGLAQLLSVTRLRRA
ncbi:MFS transporter [Streptomyces sp. NPDC006997]|uniref:MFS transporter n=1 Tax=Streptomyces sp. NPDC006997 TaxID=3155356 RepID=UPI0033EF30EB